MSGVIYEGNIVVFDESGSFILPGQCVGVTSVREATTGVQGRISLHAKKMECLSCGPGSLKKLRRRVSVRGEPLERAEHPAESAWATRKPVERNILGTVDELGTTNPGAEASREAPGAPSVLAGHMDDVNMADEVAQGAPVMLYSSVAMKLENRDAGTARRITCWQSVQVFDCGVRPVCKGEAEPRDTSQRAARKLRTAQRSLSCRGIIVYLAPEIESMRFVMRDGATNSVFAHLIPAKGVDFPSCEKVVKMIVPDLDHLGDHRVVFRCDNEPSILALLRAVKLGWTGDAVQESSAEGDPQSNGAAESSVNVVKWHVRSIKLAMESASGVEVLADHDLFIWLVPYATSMHRRFSVGRDGKTAYERSVGWRAVPPLGQFGELVWWMPLQPCNGRLGRGL